MKIVNSLRYTAGLVALSFLALPTGCGGDNSKLLGSTRDTGTTKVDPVPDTTGPDADTFSPQDTASPDVQEEEDTLSPPDVQEDTSVTPTEGVSLVEYSFDASNAVCAKLYECGAEIDSVRAQLEMDFAFSDVFGCQEKLSYRLFEASRRAMMGAEAGRLTYSDTQAAACVDALATSSCQDLAGALQDYRFDRVLQTAACSGVLTPGQALTQECLTPDDCAGQDVFCDGAAYTSTDQTLGECTSLGTNGSFCSGAFACAEGLYCDMQSGECAPIPGAGEACSRVCEEGYFCDQTCLPLGDAGAECFLDEDCKPGLACDYSNDTCAPLPGEGGDCSDLYCAQGLTCQRDANGSICVGEPGVGASCEFSDDCAAGLVCNGSNECAVARLPGESCEPGACIWYATCSSSGACELATLEELDDRAK